MHDASRHAGSSYKTQKHTKKYKYMGYRKMGFVALERSFYIPQYSQDIIDAFGEEFLDLEVSKTFKTMGKEVIQLRNLFFQRLFTIEHPKLTADSELRQKFIIVLSDLLYNLGYITVSPKIVDYYTDPTCTLENAVLFMLNSKMPVFTREEFNGDYANIDHLMYMFPEVLRRNARVLEHRPLFVERLRRWIGNVGFKLRTGQAISQVERTALVMYGNTGPGSLGHISDLTFVGPSARKPGDSVSTIAAIEVKDPLVEEVAALYAASVLTGPALLHQKFMSDQILERLTIYFGPQVPTLEVEVGLIEAWGDFVLLDFKPFDSIAWSPSSHMTGILTRLDYIHLYGPDNSFSIKVPTILGNWGDDRLNGFILDMPEIRLILTDEDDVSRFYFEWLSKWRGRTITSKDNQNAVSQLISDIGVYTSLKGSVNVGETSMTKFGLMKLLPAAEAKLYRLDFGGIKEKYILPSPNGLVVREIDMTALYSRLGKQMSISAFTEFLEVPLVWFMQEAPEVLSYIAVEASLMVDEKLRFKQVIALCHNAARYERITGRPCPIDVMQQAKAILNIKE